MAVTSAQCWASDWKAPGMDIKNQNVSEKRYKKALKVDMQRDEEMPSTTGESKDQKFKTRERLQNRAQSRHRQSALHVDFLPVK